MTARKIIASLFFLDFLALNVYALYSSGMQGLADFFGSLGPWGYVAAADVLIALSMVTVWMWQDARQNGRSPVGYTILTALTGSLGPLLYVMTRHEREAHPVGSRHVAHAKAS